MLEGGQPALNPGDAVRLGVFDPRHLRSWRMKAESLPADWNPVGSAKSSVQVRRSPLAGQVQVLPPLSCSPIVFRTKAKQLTDSASRDG